MKYDLYHHNLYILGHFRKAKGKAANFPPNLPVQHSAISAGCEALRTNFG